MNGDPVSDFGLVIDELRQKQMLGSRSYFVAFFLRFTGDSAQRVDEAAAEASTAGWETAQYADVGGLTLRLSWEGEATTQSLQAGRAHVRAIAERRRGSWVGFVVEDVHARSDWRLVTDRLRPKAPTPREPADDAQRASGSE